MNYINQFLNRCNNIRSQNTYETYSHVLKQWFPDDKLDLSIEYIDQKLSEWRYKGLATNTIKLRLIVLNRLVEFINHRETVPNYDEIVGICGSVKAQETIQEYATEEQVKNILSCITDSKYKAILCFLYYGGCRISEVLSIQLSDIKNDGFIVRDTKNHSDRFIPFLSDVHKEILKEYLIEYKPSTFLFPGVKQNSVQVYFKRLFRQIGYDQLHLHSFRHGLVVKCLEANIDLPSIQKITGHKQLASLQKYCHVTPKMMQKVKSVFNQQV